MAARSIVHDAAFRQSRAARFWKFVDTSAGYDGCWPWIGTRLPGGYGVVTFLGNRTTAHRVAYELDKGETIPGGLNALHTCDNPPCCNPRHVFIGTQQENIEDMHEKGRAGDCRNFGENHGRAKVTDKEVDEIRERYRFQGLSQAQLAAIYGIGQSQVSRIILGQTRRGIEPIMFGERAPHAKLTDAQVAEIRSLAGQGNRRTAGYWSERRLADHFGVARSQIHRIIRGLSRTKDGVPEE